MTSKLLAALSFVFVMSLSSAQAYNIRLVYNTNLRASNSLDSAVLSSAPAGATLKVVQQFNRWLQVQHQGRTYWMAGWVSFTRVEETTPTQTQPDANIDNCCYVDRQCHSDQDWTNGYWAYQNGQCLAPAQSQPEASPQPAGRISSQIDNCCQSGWECHTEEQWRSGYQAYQNNQCAGPAQSSSAPPQIPAGVDNCCYVNQQCATDEDWRYGWAAYKHYQCRTDVPVAIEGGPIFREQILESFQMLKRLAPYWYDYTVRGLDKVVQTFSYADTYVDTINRVFYLDYGEHWPAGFTRYEHLVFTASILAHEACHVHREEAGLEAGGLVGETACMERQLEAHVAMDPNDPRTNEHRETLANIHDPSTWWW